MEYGPIPWWLAVLFVAGGLVALKLSAEKFIDGAAGVSRRIGLSPFVVGMVVVGFGTSAPELCVSVFSGLGGRSSLSLGNAYGSCICNIALILGVATLIKPLKVSRSVSLFGVPALVAISVMSCLLVSSGSGFSRADAFVSLGVFAVVLPLYCRFSGGGQAQETPAGRPDSPVWRDWALLLGGLAFLLGSSHILVWGAVETARLLGVPELVIGLTVLAVGTSLPELASAVISARRGEHDMVLGNIIGSNLFNTLAVVGLAGAISPFKGVSRHILARDMPAMVALSVSIALFALPGRGRVARPLGAVWLALYAGYIALMAFQEMQ